MKRIGRAKIAVFGVSCLWLAASYAYSSRNAPPAEPKPAQSEFFESKIRPLLSENCFSCHGKDLQASGLRLDSREAVIKGGTKGGAIVPGDPEHSLLIQAVRQTGALKMPPTGVKLPADQIANLETWVKMGAPWPSGRVKVDRPLWSLQPVQNPAVPHPKLKGWALNPIDDFVLAKLEADHLHPNSPADRRPLLRRVTYDLTGLPPTVAEMNAFLTDKSPSAYENVVDRLLSSPHYGERMAREWMDVARYADTKGYVFNEDRNYPNAYTYRNWLIDAFNRDLPYDRFIVDQLAADRLPEVQTKSDETPLAAMGFLTLGRRFLNQQPDIIDDRIDVTMRGLEAFTVGCARCHDHKFDPIPTQDYYSLYAVFASSQDANVPISPPAVSQPWEQWNAKEASLKAEGQGLIASQTKLLRDQKPDSQKPEVKQALQAVAVGAIPDGENLNRLSTAFEPEARKRLQAIHGDLDALDKQTPPLPEFANALEDSSHPADGVVFHHGSPGMRGAAAPRRFLLALSKPGVERAHWTDGSGRWELAEAIASRDNPLTARVFVNRVWQAHFGAAIVRTPSDFGHQGEPPTDPKLLDYLASSFMDGGWSIKKIQRLIVTSATYQQSSAVSDATYNKDPDNRDWGRMNRRRLDLEQMRDAMETVAGKLQLDQVGGKSVDLWSEPFTGRRALYGFIERQNLPAVFKTFDFASPDSTNARRFQTTVPQQALFFMNSPFAVETARVIAARPEVTSARDDAQRVRRLYLILFQRLPSADESKTALDFLSQPILGQPPSGQAEAGKLDRYQLYVQALLMTNEFVFLD